MAGSSSAPRRPTMSEASKTATEPAPSGAEARAGGGEGLRAGGKRLTPPHCLETLLRMQVERISMRAWLHSKASIDRSRTEGPGVP